MNKIDSKLPGDHTSIFAIMSQLAHQYDAVNLSQGFPDFPVDERLKGLLIDAIQNGHNQYAHPLGVPKLRTAIAAKIEAQQGRKYDIESEITVTAGATQAIYGFIAATIHTGDEAIILTPAYDCYAPTIQFHGGKVRAVPLDEHYKVDWDRVEEAITSRTRLIITNSPHNPSGKVFTEGDMQQLQRLVVENDLFHLSDEVYGDMVFDGRQHLSAARYDGLAERSFITGSFGKTFHVTGWKVGYGLAPEKLTKEFRKVHQNMVFCINHPAQQAIGGYLADPDSYNGISKMYEQKRDFFLSLIKNSKFQFTPTEGTYFQLLDYSAVSDMGDIAFAKAMTENHRLASIPISVFMDGRDPRQLRFCFAKEDEVLIKAAEILNSF